MLNSFEVFEFKVLGFLVGVQVLLFGNQQPPIKGESMFSRDFFLQTNH